MRVLIAPDAFVGSLDAGQVAEAIADGWRRSAPLDELTLVPLSDGGPGFVGVLSRALGGTTVCVTVADPLGRPVPALTLLVDETVVNETVVDETVVDETVVDEAPVVDKGVVDGGAVDPRGRRTAYIESAQACGLHLLAEGERNPMVTSTYGVGQLIEAAVAQGATRVVVGLGGSGTNDGGAGMLAALGAGDPEVLATGGAKLKNLDDDALAGLAAVRERLHSIDLVLATDVDSPLLGFHGASAVFAPQKGATPEMAQELESAMGRFTEVARTVVPPGRDLLTGRQRRLDREPGAGAGGGLGYGLLLLGGRRVSGGRAVLDSVGFESLVQTTDLVVTGEAIFDWRSLHGKVIAEVAQTCLSVARPVVVIAGQTLMGRREMMALGISGAYAVAESRGQIAAAQADPGGTLSARTTRVATTWSPVIT